MHSELSAVTTRFSSPSAIHRPLPRSRGTSNKLPNWRPIETMAKRVAIVGATGYAGVELTAILARHREVELVALFSSSGSVASQVTPAFPNLIAQPFTIEALFAAQPEI